MHLPRSLLLAAAPALVAAGLFVSAGTAGADSQPLVASLDGAQEVPGPGDTDGSGSATVTVDSETDELCYEVDAADITLPPAAMHIHEAPAGVAGPIVVTLDETTVNSGTETCVASGAIVDEIAAAPADYYVNVHTSDFPDGAIRGQLAAVAVTRLEGIGDGAQEVPGPGDADGTVNGTFGVAPDAGKFCYQVDATGITLPAAAMHIHEAPAGVAGGIVITLEAAAVNGGIELCTDADPALLADIAANPADYYLNVHNADFPDGAVRAQLAVAGTTVVPTTSTTAQLPTAVNAGSGGQADGAGGSPVGPLAVGLVGGGLLLAGLSAAALRRRSAS